MSGNIGNYAQHARFWDWGRLDHDRTPDDDYWYQYARRYGNRVLQPMCAWGEAGAYMARHGMEVTAFDITPEMIAEGQKRFGALPGLRLLEGDVRDFRFDIPPADFCYCVDFGHLLTIEDVQRALVCIHNHLRDGGGLVIETGLPAARSESHPLRTFMPTRQPYPHLNVWKTSEGRTEAETGRHYIAQVFHAQHEDGRVERFEHAFYLQSYAREAWLAAFTACGFEIVCEYDRRDVAAWHSGEGFWGFEVAKSAAVKVRYTPAVNLDHLRPPSIPTARCRCTTIRSTCICPTRVMVSSTALISKRRANGSAGFGSG